MNKADSLRLVKLAAKAADDKLGQEILALDVSKESTLSDYFILVTGTSHVHIRAIEDAIRQALRDAGVNLTRTDGQRGHLWRALDYGSVIIHLMDPKTRAFYALEKLWERGRPVTWDTRKPAPAKPAKAKKKAPAKKSPAKKSARKKAKRR